jgi:ParB family chromosome partitioning protein
MSQNQTPGNVSSSRGFNYRRRFNAAKMSELVEDIKRQGVLQPIIVRGTSVETQVAQPGSVLIKIRDINAGLYQLIAGNRRTKAVEIAFGEDAEIPAMVRVMTDTEAMAAMVSENKVREDTSAIEDAEAAARMLGMLNGDREETAKRLGWSPQTLNARLGIMNATDKVRDAFIDEKILLGHVEILAALIKETQDSVLEKMLARPKVPSVPELKAMAEQILLNLDAAIFEKAECGSCKFFTGTQQAMFETSFEGTRCTNRQCYEKKTETELETRRQALATDYQVVRIVRPGDNLTVVPLRAAGAKGVGEEQALACRTCGDFGACVSAAPDKLGMPFKDVCFNSTCNAEKIEARVTAEKQAQENVQAQQGETTTGVPGNSEGTPATKTASGAKQTKAPAKAASSEPRNAVKEYREAVWRKVFQRAALRLPVPQSRALLIALCLHSPRTLAHSDATKAVCKALGQESFSTTDAGKLMTALLALDQKGLSDAMQIIPAHVGVDLGIETVTQLMTALEIKVEHHWRVNEAFFELLTKTEIDAVCIELGVAKAIGADYSKLKNGGKPEYIKAILAVEGFDYVGKLPALMRW